MYLILHNTISFQLQLVQTCMNHLNRIHVTCKWNAQTKLTDCILQARLNLSQLQFHYYWKQNFVLWKADEFNYLPLVECVNFSFTNLVVLTFLSLILCYETIYLSPLSSIMLNFTVGLQRNPVITTSVYATPRLQRQILCGAKLFVTVNHTITLVSYNDTKYSFPLMML